MVYLCTDTHEPTAMKALETQGFWAWNVPTDIVGVRSIEESSNREKQNCPFLSQSIRNFRRPPLLYFLATLVNTVLHPVPENSTMLICGHSIQLKIRLLDCSFSTQQAAEVPWTAAKCAYISTTPGAKMNHLFPSRFGCSSPRRRSEFTRFGVHWNSMVNTQLGDLIYENSFKPFATLTNPVQVHWANSKVALSPFIGFQLHQHSNPEPWCLHCCMWVAEEHEFFFRRLGWKPQMRANGWNFVELSMPYWHGCWIT